MTQHAWMRRHDSGFANIPDDWQVATGPDDWQPDAGQSAPVRFALPEGYHVAMSAGGLPVIYDADGDWCEVIAHDSGRPQIVSTAQAMPILREAEERP